MATDALNFVYVDWNEEQWTGGACEWQAAGAPALSCSFVLARWGAGVGRNKLQQAAAALHARSPAGCPLAASLPTAPPPPHPIPPHSLRTPRRQRHGDPRLLDHVRHGLLPSPGPHPLVRFPGCIARINSWDQHRSCVAVTGWLPTPFKLAPAPGHMPCLSKCLTPSALLPPLLLQGWH